MMPLSAQDGGGAGLGCARAVTTYTNQSFVQPSQVQLTPNAMYASADQPAVVPLTANVMYASADVDETSRVDGNGGMCDSMHGNGSASNADVGGNIIYAIPLNDEDVAAAGGGGGCVVGEGSASRNNVYDAGVPQCGAKAASNNIYDAGTPRRRSNNNANTSSA